MSECPFYASGKNNDAMADLFEAKIAGAVHGHHPLVPDEVMVRGQAIAEVLLVRGNGFNSREELRKSTELVKFVSLF